MQAVNLKPGPTAPSNKQARRTGTYTAAWPATGYLRPLIASEVCGVAKSAIWVWTAQGCFPKAVKLPSRSVCRMADVRAWLADSVDWQAANKVGD
ncbi:AlpA family phage regulatory protein [Achromobacter insolitus]|uniref:helix-turn-helix transcriptional regulator n=1 Tax=Achromobacter insolitus TaxID=217204 RepID=UPI000AE46902